MDAILGRDDRLVDKLCQAAETIDADFAAIVGTPVPSVIGTDYKALKHMAEKKLSIPVVTVDTTGMDYYDKGIEKAYDALFPVLADPSQQAEADTVGVLGAVPLELMHPGDIEWISQSLVEDGWQQILLFDEIDDYRKAGKASLNLVLSPAGLKAAQYLQKTSGHLMSSITSASMPSSILTTTSFLARTSSSSIRLSLPRLWPPWPKKPVPLT